MKKNTVLFFEVGGVMIDEVGKQKLSKTSLDSVFGVFFFL